MELDEVSDSVGRKIERRVHHVRIDGEDRLVLLTEYRHVVFVPYLFGHGNRSVSQLFGGGVGMGVEPFPCADVHHRDAADLIHAPDLVQHFHRFGFGIALLEAQQPEVVFLEYEGERFGEGGVRNAVEHVVVHVVHGDGLFHIVAELVNGDVVAFVVHAVVSDAGAEMRLGASHAGSPGMTGTAGGINDHLVCDPLGLLGRESHLGEDVRKILLHGFGIGIELARHRGELVFVHVAARLESVIPDVERLQLAVQTFADDLAHRFQFGS